MNIILALIVLIFSAILHEIAHGFVADRLGDPTARLMGRLTLDPRKHIDPILSIAVPLILILSGSPIIFGGAKPVPVDEFNLKEGRKDAALVALAGPLTNILLAIVASLLSKAIILFEITIPSWSFILEPLFLLFLEIVYYNLLLAIFNLIPIPPLDGSKVFALLLPEKQARSYLAIGSIGIFIILFLLVFSFAGFSLSNLIQTLVTFLENLLGI